MAIDILKGCEGGGCWVGQFTTPVQLEELANSMSGGHFVTLYKNDVLPNCTTSDLQWISVGVGEL